MAKPETRPESDRKSVEGPKQACAQRSPRNLTDLECVCKEQWENIPK